MKIFFFSSRRRHTRWTGDWSSDVCSSDLDLSEAKTPEMLQYEYARSGLKLGLKLEGEIGVNPYKFGMIGSTDSHTGLTAVEEDNYFGKTSAMEPSSLLKNPWP